MCMALVLYQKRVALQLIHIYMEGQWLSGRVLDLRPEGCEFEPQRHHCGVSLSKNINSSLVLFQPRKTCLL